MNDKQIEMNDGAVDSYFRVSLHAREGKDLPGFRWDEGNYPTEEVLRRRVREYAGMYEVPLRFLRRNAYLLIEHYCQAQPVSLVTQSVC